MRACVSLRESYEASAEGETNENLRILMDVHLTSKAWHPTGSYGRQSKHRIWMRVVRREARMRGLL